MSEIDEARLLEQERVFAEAFASHDLGLARRLYQPDVIYRSPTVRLFDWPARVEGMDRTLEFIGLTIRGCLRIEYAPQEWACPPDGRSAFVRLHFDWDQGEARLRSNYVVLYRYHAARIAQQELYYDPSGRVEQSAPSGRARAHPAASGPFEEAFSGYAGALAGGDWRLTERWPSG